MSLLKEILTEAEKETTRLLRPILKDALISLISAKTRIDEETVKILYNVASELVKAASEKDWKGLDKFDWVKKGLGDFIGGKGLSVRIGNADIHLMIEGAYSVEIRFDF